MQPIDTAGVFRFHKELLKEYGTEGSGALGWVSDAAQQARFKVFVDLADLNNHSVMDVGCGFGDLRNFLSQYYPHLHYFGVEQIPAFVEVAAKRHLNLPETVFFQGDFVQADLPVTDYIIACGSLNYRNNDPNFIYTIITKLFHHCRNGFAFNLLNRTEPPDSLLAAYSPALITDHCKTLTDKIVVKDDYWVDDFTVMLYH